MDAERSRACGVCGVCVCVYVVCNCHAFISKQKKHTIFHLNLLCSFGCQANSTHRCNIMIRIEFKIHHFHCIRFATTSCFSLALKQIIKLYFMNITVHTSFIQLVAKVFSCLILNLCIDGENIKWSILKQTRNQIGKGKPNQQLHCTAHTHRIPISKGTRERAREGELTKPRRIALLTFCVAFITFGSFV